VLAALLGCGLWLSCGAGSGAGNKELTHIKIAPANQTIAKGATLQLSATGYYSDGTAQALGATVTWQTSQPAVATIDAQGDVTGGGVGVTQISAAYEGVAGATSVTVGPPALLAITVSPNQSSLPAGESAQFTATGNFSDGTVQNLTNRATWTSSAPAIASVGPDGAAVAIAVGTLTISATVGYVTGTAGLIVTPAVVIALSIVPATVSMVLENTRQFQAIATLSNGTTQNMTATVTWSSAQPGVASVSSGGLVTANQVGSTTILAEASGVTGSSGVTVTPLLLVSYFDVAYAKKSGYDGTLQLTNPGLTSGSLCAMVYVFDRSQELNECCGCMVSDSGLRTLSLLYDLTANPLTGKQPQAGIIEIVSSDPTSNPTCNPGSLAPAGAILGWETNAQPTGGGTFQETETSLSQVPLGGEGTFLENECSYLMQLGSGKGICSCGTGNE
jgi:hypothetical protein